MRWQVWRVVNVVRRAVGGIVAFVRAAMKVSSRRRFSTALRMHWSGEHDRLSEEQVALHKSQLRHLSDVQLQRSYEMYLGALALDKGQAPAAATVQYFVECWRELRLAEAPERVSLAAQPLTWRLAVYACRHSREFRSGAHRMPAAGRRDSNALDIVTHRVTLS